MTRDELLALAERMPQKILKDLAERAGDMLIIEIGGDGKGVTSIVRDPAEQIIAALRAQAAMEGEASDG